MTYIMCISILVSGLLDVRYHAKKYRVLHLFDFYVIICSDMRISSKTLSIYAVVTLFLRALTQCYPGSIIVTSKPFLAC